MINRILWTIYILLLAVLLPHTAWAFAQGEPDTLAGHATGWAAAIVFELVIAAMTHKLARHIEQTPRYRHTWHRLRARYLNAYGGGLALAWCVSTYANLAHAVEFGRPLAVFGAWAVPAWSFPVMFGGILPTASLLFAWVLSTVIEADATEHAPNSELEAAKSTVRDLRSQLATAERHRMEAEQRFAAAGDMFARLMHSEKRERILFAAGRWPELPMSSIAVVTGASTSYVSEVMKEADDGGG